ncbi:hypothetical protein MPER_03885 [Moniliophthora perniciosa FA553]|nr:hypothetical protein MPER_03885 [Moniliophthora perniciosa FA553]
MTKASVLKTTFLQVTPRALPPTLILNSMVGEGTESGNADSFSQVGHHTGKLVVASELGYNQNPLDTLGTASYGLTRRSEAEYYEFVDPITSSPFHNLQSGSNHPASPSFTLTACSEKSPYAPQFPRAAGPSHTPAATDWTASASDCRYDATYPLSITNDSADNVPGP